MAIEMGMSITIGGIAVCVGLAVWLRRRGKATIKSAPQEIISSEASAHKAFVSGNTCLMKGDFAEAIALFQQALELNPKHHHAASRLAEAGRRQMAQASEAVPKAS